MSSVSAAVPALAISRLLQQEPDSGSCVGRNLASHVSLTADAECFKRFPGAYLLMHVIFPAAASTQGKRAETERRYPAP
jgi:hypothetical protein